jgi:hypothetical protein
MQIKRTHWRNNYCERAINRACRKRCMHQFESNKTRNSMRARSLAIISRTKLEWAAFKSFTRTLRLLLAGGDSNRIRVLLAAELCLMAFKTLFGN